MGERVVRLTSGLKPYTQRSAVSVWFAVREAGVDGRARAMYLKTNLGKSVMNSQILTTWGWTPPRPRGPCAEKFIFSTLTIVRVAVRKG